MIIAIDGPSASGKGTLARQIAKRFGLPHLDTGLLYRALALVTLQKQIDLQHAKRVAGFAENLDPERFDLSRLRQDDISVRASKIAAFPEVREALLQKQRDFAAQPGGAVLDGRDIGTVICPQAEIKLFVTARQEVRAMRRYKELSARGVVPPYAQILADIQGRDARDSERETAPLKPASDAFILDNSELDVMAAYDIAVGYIQKTFPG